ncbi:glycoside hydrolase family 3 C-terminal domain-containing protein [Micrococcales bacterium 31B]|nr:glycoside hydrolase family 3 C-terminal domain-containing protein [Micrococcales bacterium 31B]
MNVARRADVAVVVVGTSPDWEMEGGDRPQFALPGAQAELVRQVAAANPHTIVVVNAGAAVDLPFSEEVDGLLYAWFGGQEMGHAVAEVLFGTVDPGGRLPLSIPREASEVLYFNYRGGGGAGWGAGPRPRRHSAPRGTGPDRLLPPRGVRPVRTVHVRRETVVRAHRNLGSRGRGAQWLGPAYQRARAAHESFAAGRHVRAAGVCHGAGRRRAAPTRGVLPSIASPRCSPSR